MPLQAQNRFYLKMMICGLMLGLSAPGFGLWPLAWLALIPALYWVGQRDRLKSVFWGGFWLGLVYHGMYCLWFFDLHPLTWMGFGELESRLVTLAGWLLIVVEGGLLMGLLMMAYAKLKPGWQRLGLFPVLWVFGFSILNWTPLALPWALLEYTQAGLWPMRWLASTISASGLTFLLVLHNAFWAERLNQYLGKRLDFKVVGLALLAPLMIGLLHLSPIAQTSKRAWPMPVAVIQANLPIEIIRSGKLKRDIIEPAYIDPVEKINFPKGTLLVYPEEGVAPGWTPLEAPQQNAMLIRLARLAREKQIYIAVGISSMDRKNRYHNSIALISPHQPSPQFYHKRRLVPFGESTPYGLGPELTRLLASLNIAYSTPYEAGTESLLFQAESVKIGGLVCFELIDSAPFGGGYSAQYKKQGAELLINTSNLGWFHENPLLEAQFLAIGQMRAAETGLPLVISSNTGTSAILSPRGEVLRRTHFTHSDHQKTQVIFFNEEKKKNKKKSKLK